ncbi:MAG TPA: phosphoribosylanthranilate isomerase [bacterium]|nr:phosphoribosylanthranilate isomerase [bacterium]
MSLRVKVCGLTSLEDAKLAEACGAHALGFIFYAPSPRCAEPAEVARIVADLHPYTLKVGVFVGESVERMNELAEQCRLDRIQLHGGEPYETLARLNRPGYRAFKLKDEADLAAAREAPDTTLMLDTYDPALQGGTGRPANWEWARSLGETRRVILAGGLSAENIAAALRTARPAGVDVSSSLEAAPGRKDAHKVEAFFAALRRALTPDETWSASDAIAS